MDPSAAYPLIFGGQYGCAWDSCWPSRPPCLFRSLNRSTLGFEFRAVGANPKAALTAGINVSRATILVMTIAGGLAGLAGVARSQAPKRS